MSIVKIATIKLSAVFTRYSHSCIVSLTSGSSKVTAVNQKVKLGAQKTRESADVARPISTLVAGDHAAQLNIASFPGRFLTNRTPGEKYGLVWIVFGRVCRDRKIHSKTFCKITHQSRQCSTSQMKMTSQLALCWDTAAIQGNRYRKF